MNTRKAAIKLSERKPTQLATRLDTDQWNLNIPLALLLGMQATAKNIALEDELYTCIRMIKSAQDAISLALDEIKTVE